MRVPAPSGQEWSKHVASKEEGEAAGASEHVGCSSSVASELLHLAVVASLGISQLGAGFEALSCLYNLPSAVRFFGYYADDSK